MKLCLLCGSGTEVRFKRQVLHQYEVSYFYCDQCGLMQTEKPYWLKEAYHDAIVAADTGVVSRNLFFQRQVAVVLNFLFDGKGCYLDYGGGYGLFTRLMRDVGFDFYWQDPYCENLFARGFSSTEAMEPFKAVTCFEVMEHIEHPLEFVTKCLEESECRTFIFSTELMQNPPPEPDAWHYYLFNTGQHISFYQERTLRLMAKKLKMTFVSHGNLHLFTDQKINETHFRHLTGRFNSLRFFWLRRRNTSLMISDHEKVSRGR